jgi:hypothetical protein
MINNIMIEAKAINRRLQDKHQAFMGQQAPDEIAAQLQQILKPWRVRVTAIGCSDVGIQEFSIGGLYDAERKRQPIILNIFFNKRQKKFIWFQHHLKEFFFLVSQVLQHELVHKNQISQRPEDARDLNSCYQVVARSDLQEEADYLSEFDEIDAYAHDIALEIVHYYPGTDRFEILRTINRRRFVYSWRLYKKTFRDCDDWSDIRHRLLSKVYRWLPHIIE